MNILLYIIFGIIIAIVIVIVLKNMNKSQSNDAYGRGAFKHVVSPTSVSSFKHVVSPTSVSSFKPRDTLTNAIITAEPVNMGYACADDRCGIDKCVPSEKGTDTVRHIQLYPNKPESCYEFCALLSDDGKTLSKASLAVNNYPFQGIDILWPGPPDTRGNFATHQNEYPYVEICHPWHMEAKYTYFLKGNYLTDASLSKAGKCVAYTNNGVTDPYMTC
jgi:hypothetical protein